MTNRTLADLLREDGAQAGDVYEACGRQWTVNVLGKLVYFSDEGSWCFGNGDQDRMPAEGWKSVTPKKPLRVEFETEVQPCGDGSISGKLPSSSVYLQPLIGKRVRVTVEEVEG
jgi:hypothetical protein